VKLNLGSGNSKVKGFTSLDNWADCKPEILHDLSVFPWPVKDNSVDEVLANHVIEHLQDTVGTMKELYRICKGGASIQINVPHWASDDQVNDPTHVRAITPEMMALFSKGTCEQYQKLGAANTPLALMHHVDFTLEKIDMALDERFQHWQNDPALDRMMALNRNIVREVRMTLRVNKEK